MGGHCSTCGRWSESEFGDAGGAVVASSHVACVEADQSQAPSEFSERVGLHRDVEGILERLILSHAKFTLGAGRLGRQLVLIGWQQLCGEFDRSRVQEA